MQKQTINPPVMVSKMASVPVECPWLGDRGRNCAARECLGFQWWKFVAPYWILRALLYYKKIPSSAWVRWESQEDWTIRILPVKVPGVLLGSRIAGCLFR